MRKKSLIILFIAIAIVFISNICFASNMGNDIKNAMYSGTNAIVDGTQNLANDVRNGIGNVENGIEDVMTMDNNNSMLKNDIDTTNNYVAQRTMTTATGSDLTTMWVWVILAIATIVIVALVWYYGSQNHID